MGSGNPAAGAAGAQPRRSRFVRQRTAAEIAFDAFNYLLLGLFCLTVLYPFWTTLILSLSGPDSASSLGMRLWSEDFQFTAYRFAMSRYGKVTTAYGNSIARTGLGIALTVSLTVLAAYPLSKRNLPGRSFLTVTLLITMFFSGGLIPTYLLIRNLGMFDTIWALVLPNAVLAYYVIIMRNFHMTIDDAYEESAYIDGANYLQILLRIVVPLSKPVIAVITLWTAVLHWNSWFDALIYTRSESKIVLQVLLRRLLQEMQIFGIGNQMESFMELRQVELPSEAVKAAVTIMTIGPIVLVYPFIQRHFIKGILLGSLKG